MTSDESPARSHLRTMEARIEQQIELIERLKQSGQDTTEAVRRLALLQHAIGEMRTQLGQLSPIAPGTKKPDATRSAPVGELC